MTQTIACAVALLFAANVHSATCAWNGAGADSKWSTATNWTSCNGTHPVGGDSLAFPESAARKTNTNDLPSLALAAITFTGLNYDISGNAITLSGGIKTNTGTGSFSDLGPRFRPDITLAASQSLFCQAGKFLYLDGTISAGNYTLLVDGTCNTALRGSLTGSGAPGSGSIQKYGTGSLYLTNGPHPYSGFNLLSDGTTYVGTDSGLGTGGVDDYTYVGPGAQLSLYLDVSVPEFVGLSSSTLENFIGNNTLEKYLSVENGGTITVTYADDTLTLNGITADTAGVQLTKNGPGRLVLNQYADASFDVTSGTLEADGGILGFANLVGGSTLSGDGAVSGVIAMTPGTRLAPGTRGSPGTLSGSVVSWSATAEMRMRLGARSDRLALSGSIDAGDNGVHQFVFLDGNTPPKVGATYTLIDYAQQDGLVASALNSTFAYNGTGFGASLNGTFNVGANHLTFTVSAVTSDLLFRDGFN